MYSSNRQYPIFFPRGVAEPNKQIGYISNIESDISALTLSNGKLVWSSNIVSKPIIAFDNFVVAFRYFEDRKNLAEIIMLDTSKNGECVFRSEEIVFPEWVSLDDVSLFSLTETYLTEKRILVIKWSAQKKYKGGAPPPMHLQAEHSGFVVGQHQINLISGEVDRQESFEKRSTEETVDVQFLQEEGLFQTDSWKADEKTAALFWDLSGKSPAIHLRAGDQKSETVTCSKQLLSGEALVPKITRDGLYVLVYQETPLENSSVYENKKLHVFSAKTGDELYGITFEQGIRDACIIDRSIYYLLEKQTDSAFSLSIRAKDLSTDKLIWEYFLGETALQTAPALMK